MTTSTDRVERAERLRALHASPDLLQLVDVWDVASARAVAATPGCTAISTASAAIAAAHGYDDGEVIPWAMHLATIGRICRAVEVPVLADLERGYGAVEATVAGALAAGAVGVDLEDHLCPLDELEDRVASALGAGADAGVPVVIGARTDVWVHPAWVDATEDARLREAVRRGQACLAAGADTVLVVGCVDRGSIAALVDAFGRGRLSLLVAPGMPPGDELAALGVARLSHGADPQRFAHAALGDFAAARYR